MVDSITYRTDDGARWGAGSGADLDPHTVDVNFWSLNTRTTNLETNPVQPVGIDHFIVSGNQMTVVMTDGTTRGPYTLPVAAWRFRDAWQPSTVYSVDDVVTANGNVYLVLQNHTSGTTFDPAAVDSSGHQLYGLLLTNPGSSLPSGGAPGTVLTKRTVADFDVTWDTPDRAELGDVAIGSPLSMGNVLTYNGTHWTNETPTSTESLPSGGATGQFLVKHSATNYDVGWAMPTLSTLGDMVINSPLDAGDYITWNGTHWISTDFPTNELVPPGGAAGYVLTKHTAVDFDVIWEPAASGTAGVTSWNTRTGAVTMTGSDITNAGGAMLASPTFTGTPAAPTATAGTSTTQIATTAFVQAAVVAGGGGAPPSTANPLMDGTAAPGTHTPYSREDHVHPSDTSRAPVASPTFTGTPAAPTATAGTNTTQIATTAFVTTAVAGGGATPSNSTPLMDGTAAPGTSALYSRGDHVHPSDTSRAPTASPALTGTPTGPTAASGTNSAQLATTAFVQAALLSPPSPPPPPATAAIGAGAGSLMVNSSAAGTGMVTVNTGRGMVALSRRIGPGAPSPYVTSVTAGAGLTGGGTGAVTIAVATGGITNALAAQMPADTIKGNNTSSTAAPIDMTVAQTQTLLGVPTASSTTPAMDGTASAGSATTFSRGDHVHPTDTSRAALASPTFTGTPAAPTAAVSTNTTQVATTAFVLGQVGTATPVMDGTAAVGTSLLYSRQDHVHPSDTTKMNTANPQWTGALLGGGTTATLGVYSGAGVWTTGNFPFQVQSPGSIGAAFYCNGGAGTGAVYSRVDSTATPLVTFSYTSTTNTGTITTNGTTTSYNTSSDARLKDNVRPLASETDVGAIIDLLRPVTFEWTHVEGRPHGRGFVAQDLYAVIPEAVTPGHDDPAKQPWGVDASKIVPFLVAEVQLLRRRVAELEAV